MREWLGGEETQGLRMMSQRECGRQATNICGMNREKMQGRVQDDKNVRHRIGLP